jgi:hypothetical protein
VRCGLERHDGGGCRRVLHRPGGFVEYVRRRCCLVARHLANDCGIVTVELFDGNRPMRLRIQVHFEPGSIACGRGDGSVRFVRDFGWRRRVGVVLRQNGLRETNGLCERDRKLRFRRFGREL